MSDPKQSAPADQGSRQGQDASQRRIAITQAERQAMIAAASQALPIGELDAQSFGDRGNYGIHIRGSMLAARRRSIRFLVRAAERSAEFTGIESRHIETALKSLRLYPGDLLVNPLTGEWLSTRHAIAHRGREVAHAIAELAMIVKEIEQEGAANP